MGRTLIAALVAGALVVGFGGGILGAFLFRQDISPLETGVGNLEGRLQAAMGDVTAIEAQVSDLRALAEDVAALRSRIDSLEGRLQGVEGDIAALEAQASSAEERLQALEEEDPPTF